MTTIGRLILVMSIATSFAHVGGAVVQSDSAEARRKVSVIAHNGMPKNIVARGHRWDFGRGSARWPACYFHSGRNSASGRFNLEHFRSGDYLTLRNANRENSADWSTGTSLGACRVALLVGNPSGLRLSPLLC